MFYQNTKQHREVLEDTLEEGNVDVEIRKTDTVTVNLTSKMSTDVFHPPLDDAIDAALCFDKTLRYVTFNVSSFENKDRHSNIAKPTGPMLNLCQIPKVYYVCSDLGYL
jgi:hypothetical protein